MGTSSKDLKQWGGGRVGEGGGMGGHDNIYPQEGDFLELWPYKENEQPVGEESLNQLT